MRIAERSPATKTQKWAEQMATGGRAWRRCQGHGDLAEGVLAVSSARESWPKKIVTVRKIEKGNSLLVLDADERLAVVTVDEEGHETSYEHVDCLEDAVIDACSFLGSDTEAVVITALGKAMLIDWQQNCIVKTFSTADDEAADEGEPVRRAESVRFRKCSGGDQHVVLLDRHGKLWSCGSGPAVGRVKHVSDAEDLSCLRPVDFFLGRRVMTVAAGRDFCVALADTAWQAQPSTSPTTSLSPTRNSCPLGLPLKADAASSSSDETVEYRRRRQRPSCGDSDSGNVSHDSGNATVVPDSEQQVDHLTQSGLFINRKDAMKYLSDQLQWIGLQSPDAKEDAQQTTAEAATADEDATSASAASAFSVSGILKATGAAAADGVKRVSQTVARLSTSLSVTSEWAEGEEVCELPLISAPTATEALVEEASRHALLLHRRSQSTSVLERTASAPPTAGGHVSAAGDSASPWTSGPYVHTEVFFWGRGNRGQAGQKDMLDRLQPCQVTALADMRIQKIVCGQSHTLALSLSGCVYGWGDNSCFQSSPQCQFKVCSTPSRVTLPEGETAADIAAGSTSSYILTDSGNVYCIGRDAQRPLLNLDAVQDGAVPARIACVNDYCVLSEHWTDSTVGRYKALEKQLLTSLEAVHLKMAAVARTHLSTQSEEAKVALKGALHLLVEICSNLVQADWPAHLLSHCGELALIKDSSRFERAALDFHQAVLDCLVGDCIPDLDLNPEATPSGTVRSPEGSESHKATLQCFFFNWTGALDLLIDCLMAMSIEGRKGKTLAVLRACDCVEKCASNLKGLQKGMERARQVADETCRFWDTAGPRILPLKTPRRRVILDSKVVPITLSHASSFTKTWIILMNDSLVVHSGYSGVAQYSLHVVWVEGFGQDESKADPQNRHEISLITPEDTLVLVAPNAVNKTDWLNALQRSILDALYCHQAETSPRSRSPPIARKATYSFCKSSDLRGATYDGCWLQGKMHGSGTLTWPDGRVYRGLWRHNEQHGSGRLETPLAVYEGQWTRGRFEGRGRILHTSGDTYEGMLKDGKPHGQGVFKQGRFLGSGASVYNGEWVNGFRHGYGVADDIVAGEKYMGMFANDVKSGPGCVVTLDGVYYEGIFSHGKMCGKGLMLFEDETCYEGNFADAGVFSGQGTLTYANGDRLEGVFYGNYTDGMKFNGTVYRNTKPPQPGVVLTSQNTPLNKERLGQFCVTADRKWTALFSHYYDTLSIGDTSSKQAANTGLVWEHMAILINQSKNSARVKLGPSGCDALDGLLETIPEWQCSELNHAYLRDVDEYLSKAFISPLHPLHDLLTSLTNCFNATYGSVRVHPRLLKHAVEEFESVVRRLYEVVRALFPALPDARTQRWVAAADDLGQDEHGGRMVSASSVMHQHIVPQISASLFMLYALHYKKDDDEYWSRILKWNRNPDIALLSFLGVKQCFWQFEQQMSSALSDRSRNNSGGGGGISQIRDRHFVHAIETLQHIKTKFTPLEKLSVILDTFREINRVGQEMSGASFCWSMDELFPVFQYIVIRARILQLGAEIHLIQDLVEPYLLTGEYGFMLITLQAAYYQILKESLSI